MYIKKVYYSWMTLFVIISSVVFSGTAQAQWSRVSMDVPVAEVSDKELRKIMDQITKSMTREVLEGKANIGETLFRQSAVRFVTEVKKTLSGKGILIGETGKASVVRGAVPELAKQGIHVDTLDVHTAFGGAESLRESQWRLDAILRYYEINNKTHILHIPDVHQFLNERFGDTFVNAVEKSKAIVIADITTDVWQSVSQKFERLTRVFASKELAKLTSSQIVDTMRPTATEIEARMGITVDPLAKVEAAKLAKDFFANQPQAVKANEILSLAAARASALKEMANADVESLKIDIQAGNETIREFQEALKSGAYEPGSNEYREASKALEEKSEEVKKSQAVLERLEMQVEMEKIIDEKKIEIEKLEKSENAKESTTEKTLETHRQELAKMKKTYGAEFDADVARNKNSVTRRDVVVTVARMLGIDTEFVETRDNTTILDRLSKGLKNIIGQESAKKAFFDVFETALAKVGANISGPRGVFFFAGLPGTGKTEFAKVTTKAKFGIANEANLIRIDMSEFTKSHTVSALIGSPPGYVGFGEMGALTRAVLANPEAIILLDEFNMAHEDVKKIFYQVFEDGRLTDKGTGITVKFNRATIILTGNVGMEYLVHERGSEDRTRIENKLVENKIMTETELKDLRSLPAVDREVAMVKKYMTLGKDRFPDALIDRITKIMIFDILDFADFSKVVGIQVKRLVENLKQVHGIKLSRFSTDVLVEIGKLYYVKGKGNRITVAAVDEVVGRMVAKAVNSGRIRTGDELRLDVTRSRHGNRPRFTLYAQTSSGEKVVAVTLAKRKGTHQKIRVVLSRLKSREKAVSLPDTSVTSKLGRSGQPLDSSTKASVEKGVNKALKAR